MARYKIKQKYFALNDTFDITDESGYARYQCESKLITVPKKFWLQNSNGKPLYYVRRKMIHWLGYPVFNIYKGEDKSGGLVAKVKVKYAFIGRKLKVYSDVYGDFYIRGYHGWTFNIHANDKHGDICATMEKHIFKVADTYDINVVQGKDSFMLTLCIILDYLYHKKH